MAGEYTYTHASTPSDDDLEQEEEHVPSTAHLSTAELRALAQSHLLSIEAENNLDAQAQIQAQAELARYAKTRRRGKGSTTTTQTKSSSAGSSRLLPTEDVTNTSWSSLSTTSAISRAEAKEKETTKLRPAADILDRLRWDPTINLSEYHIGYLERFEGIQEIPVRSWKRELTDEDFIPMHRIRWIKRRWTPPHSDQDHDQSPQKQENEMVVWDRDAKIDRIFSSVSPPSTTISTSTSTSATAATTSDGDGDGISLRSDDVSTTGGVAL